MSSSIFIARLLGPVFLVVGIALLLKRRMFHEILQELIRSQVLLYLAGFLGLLAGLALVLTHNVWVLDWMLIITLIGWMTLARAMQLSPSSRRNALWPWPRRSSIIVNTSPAPP